MREDAIWHRLKVIEEKLDKLMISTDVRAVAKIMVENDRLQALDAYNNQLLKEIDILEQKIIELEDIDCECLGEHQCGR